MKSITDRGAQLLSAVRALPHVEGDWGPWRELPESLQKELLAAHFCPSCAAYMQLSLMEFSEGNQWEYAGYQCPNCEDFYSDGVPQPEFGEMCTFSDADPGL